MTVSATPQNTTGSPIGHGRSEFPPIADYAFLSDCETTCLVAPNGAVEWMCAPRPDSASVFTAMLDRAAGSFRVGPHGVNVPAARRYLPGTLVLETTWQTSTGWLIVRDALVMGPWHNVEERSKTHHRTPTDYDAEHCLLRTVKCVSGAVEVSVVCSPLLDYGRLEPDWAYVGQGYNQATARLPGKEGGLHLSLSTDLRLGLEGRIAHARTRLTEGDEVFVALTWSPLPAPQSFAEANEKMWRTAEYWREWISQGAFPDHPWRGFLQRSALTLKGLTYAPTGALLAAATTSLPETPGGNRNYDYRYAWIRDSTFALWGLYTLGLDREANDLLRLHLRRLLGGPEPADHVRRGRGDEPRGGRAAAPLRLRGRASGPRRQRRLRPGAARRVGCGARLCLPAHTKSREQMPESLWPLLKKQVEAAIRNWEKPDRGIWEVRGEPQHFVSSKLFCWVAVDRGVRLARLHDEPDYAEQWQKVADEIHADICENGVDARGAFVQRYGSDALDASLLLVPLLRFLPREDERVRTTVLAIADELTEDGFVLRYRVEETDDGFSGKEGSFTICSFWLVSALVEIGELERAHALCSKLLSFASRLRLYAEEIDADTGRHLGNFPQAFTHLALINAVIHVIRAEEAAGARLFSPAHIH